MNETRRSSLTVVVPLILASFIVCVLTFPAIAQNANSGSPSQVSQPAQHENLTQADGPQESSQQSETFSKPLYLGPAKLAWDTTVKYSPLFRLSHRSDALTSPIANPSNPNLDDGDNNFHGGLVQDRVDFLTEMDISFGPNFGFRGSAAAWFDSTYNRRTANVSPFGTYNALSADQLHFPSGTKDLMFLQAELLDAFVHVRIPMEDSVLTFRGGQFAQQWGQTLFFGANGIAGGMSPVDLVKLLSLPNAQFKEIIRPVPQISMVLQVNRKLSIGAYYQLQWQATRMPPAGSYFSSGDVLGQGSERFWFGEGVWLKRIGDVEAKNWGQFGVEVLVAAPHGWDLGFYGIQFHDKTPQLDVAPGMDPNNFNPAIGLIGSYSHVYHENIKAFGMSASKTIGIVNYAGEISGRLNQDLSGSIPIYFGPPQAWNNNKIPLYPVGDTIHANLSALAALHPNAIARESSIAAEVAWNDLVSVTKNSGWWNLPSITGNCGSSPSYSQTNPAVCNSATHNAMIMMAVYTPTYRQVLPGVDLSIPIGINGSPFGRSVLGPGFNTYHGGFFNIGASLAYRDANRFSITYQRFYGKQIGSIDQNNLLSFGQSFGDRNYISISIYRTFGVRASQKSK